VHCGGSCGGVSGKSTTILGEKFYDICNEIYHVNNKKVDFANPDKTVLKQIAKLLELASLIDSITVIQFIVQ